MEHRVQLGRLSGDEWLVVLLFYFGELGKTSEAQVASDLTDLLGEPWSRDRVHTVRRSALRTLRRSCGVVPAETSA